MAKKKATIKSKEVTPKELLFCKEYIIDLNGTRAYLRVYATKNENTARTQASKLLAKPNIKKKIKELMKDREKRVEITADMVIKEIASVAFLDIGEFFNENGILKSPNEIDKKARGAISSVTSREEYRGKGKEKEVYEVRTIRTNDKMKALEMLGRHLGMFKNEIDLGGDVVFSVKLPDELNNTK